MVRQTSSDRQRPLPVIITEGMRVVDVDGGINGTIVGFTSHFGIYKIDMTESLVVSPWRELALCNICPADPLLPADVTENDRRNAQANALRELLALRQFGLSTKQIAVLNELVEAFCP